MCCSSAGWSLQQRGCSSVLPHFVSCQASRTNTGCTVQKKDFWNKTHLQWTKPHLRNLNIQAAYKMHAVFFAAHVRNPWRSSSFLSFGSLSFWRCEQPLLQHPSNTGSRTVSLFRSTKSFLFQGSSASDASSTQYTVWSKGTLAVFSLQHLVGLLQLKHVFSLHCYLKKLALRLINLGNQNACGQDSWCGARYSSMSILRVPWAWGWLLASAFAPAILLGGPWGQVLVLSKVVLMMVMLWCWMPGGRVSLLFLPGHHAFGRHKNRQSAITKMNLNLEGKLITAVVPLSSWVPCSAVFVPGLPHEKQR